MAFMSYRADEHASRRVIDVAIGILIGLRGCSQREAFEELAGGASSARHAEAFTAWGELLGRGRLAQVAAVS